MGFAVPRSAGIVVVERVAEDAILKKGCKLYDHHVRVSMMSRVAKGIRDMYSQLH